MLKYFELLLTVSALISFCYGSFRFIMKKHAIFLNLIVLGVGCAFMGRLFETLQLFIYGEFPKGFQVGTLGIIGCFLFFFTANLGQMDSIVDDGSKENRKYRLIGLLAPVTLIALFCVFEFRTGFNPTTISDFSVVLFISLASYFHLKLLIIPDVENGVIGSLRLYNLLALIYGLLCCLEYLADSNGALIQILYVLLSLLHLLFIPVLERGFVRWTT